MTNTKVPCFVCGKELEDIGNNYNQPMGGTEFSTYGHYGSGVFDPMDGSEIIINICNECMVNGIGKNRVLHSRPVSYAHEMEVYKFPYK
jgi:hypothetical protein